MPSPWLTAYLPAITLKKPTGWPVSQTTVRRPSTTSSLTFRPTPLAAYASGVVMRVRTVKGAPPQPKSGSVSPSKKSSS